MLLLAIILIGTWQIVQIALPAATTIGVLAAATCAWIHVRHDLRRERRYYNE